MGKLLGKDENNMCMDPVDLVNAKNNFLNFLFDLNNYFFSLTTQELRGQKDTNVTTEK